MQAAGQGVSIGVRVGSSTYKAVFSIKAKAQISLSYGFWLQLPNLLTNLLFLRIEAFWGGQLC